MKRVTGIGGIFFKSPNPQALNAWYRDHLGLGVSEWGGAVFEWGGPDSSPGMTLWTPLAENTNKMDPSNSSFMINFRVENLEPLLVALRSEGCNVVGEQENSDYGKFGWVLDPDGNKIELWEPPASK